MVRCSIHVLIVYLLLFCLFITTNAYDLGYERELGIAHIETLALMRGLVVSLLGQFHEGDYEGNNTLGHALASQAVEIARTCAQRSDEAYGKTHAEALLNKKTLIEALLAADKKVEADGLVAM